MLVVEPEKKGLLLQRLIDGTSALCEVSQLPRLAFSRIPSFPEMPGVLLPPQLGKLHPASSDSPPPGQTTDTNSCGVSEWRLSVACCTSMASE